jgi:hypothetical protein
VNVATSNVNSNVSLTQAPFVDGFEQAIYWITVSRDDFDVSRFREALPGSVGQRDDVTVRIASNEHVGYHAFFGWTVTDEDITFSIEYNKGQLAHDGEENSIGPKEDGPPAEDLMRWLGQFFTTTSVTAHAHLRYRYSVENRQSTFPLSLATEPPCGAELYGVALRLSKKPDGVVSVRLTRSQSDWYAELICDRQVRFIDFSPLADAQQLLVLLGQFLEGRAT